MSVSYSLWYNVFKKHCHTKAFEVQNDPTRSASLINLFELGRIVQARKASASLSGSSRGRAAPLSSMSNASPPAPYCRNPLRRKTFPDFRFPEVKTSENQKSRVPKNRSQDFRLSEVQTSENRTQVILNLIRLISVSFIHLSIHLPQSRRADG